MPIPETAIRAAAEFADGVVLRVEPLGRGLINDTYLVSDAARRFVLQRINARVFPDPPAVMANLRALSDHARRRPVDPSGWRLPDIIPTRAGGDFHRDGAGDYWRSLSFIDGTRGLDRLANEGQAEQVGRALGRFHALANGLNPGALRDTLPGFHIAPAYLARFDAIATRPRRAPDSAELRAALDFVETRRAMVGVLEDAKARDELKLRVIHGDPKLDNVLFDQSGRRAVSLIDLDTVKPGLIHYDLGDCLRSCCNRRGEQAAEAPVFDLEVCRAILWGYAAEASGFLSAADWDYLYAAIRLLPFELGLRFLTDHLAGDVYFKVDWPGQNLARARVQFGLVVSVEGLEKAIWALVRKTAGGLSAPPNP
ncbi:phosphotransferase enzyme family protein [Methylomagnum sp.]